MHLNIEVYCVFPAVAFGNFSFFFTCFDYFWWPIQFFHLFCLVFGGSFSFSCVLFVFECFGDAVGGLSVALSVACRSHCRWHVGRTVGGMLVTLSVACRCECVSAPSIFIMFGSAFV